MKYFARITKQGRREYLVEFPDLEGCLTQGDNLRDARKNAHEALNGWLAARCDYNLDIPNPKKRKGKNDYPIDVEFPTALAIILRKNRKSQKMTQTQAAKKLGITQQAYARLEHPYKANPSLSTLEKLSKTLNINFYFDLAA